MDPRIISAKGYNLWPCTATTSGIGGYGTIEIEPGFQMISTPVVYGYWDTSAHIHVHNTSTVATVYNYIDQQISDLYSVASNTMVEVYNTLVGGQGNYWNFVPGMTNPASPHSFQLSYYDSGSGSQEVTGYFIKSIHSTTFTISWGEQ